MHPSKVFHPKTDTENLAFANSRGFGSLSINGDEGPLIVHVPFVMNDDQTFVEFHLVRSNPIARALDGPGTAVLAVSGPDSYISPDWYEGGHEQVPTWNYIAVHLRGKITLEPAETLLGHLERISAKNEALLLPKPPWVIDKMPEDHLNKLMRSILPCKLQITSVDGTWKLGQNKPTQMRISAAKNILENGQGMETSEIAKMMQDSD